MDPRTPDNSPLPPPAGTAAYDDYVADTPPDDSGSNTTGRSAIVVVLGVVIGLVAGLAIGFAAWHDGTERGAGEHRHRCQLAEQREQPTRRARRIRPGRRRRRRRGCRTVRLGHRVLGLRQHDRGDQPQRRHDEGDDLG